MAVNMGTAIAYLELDTSKFSKGFVSAYNDLRVFGDKSAKAEQKLKGLSSAFKTTGGLLSKNVTLPIVGVGAAAVLSSVKFESAFTGVRKTVDATESQFAKLKTGIEDMATSTASSAEEIAGVAEVAGQLGIKSQDILKFTETMVRLGDSTNIAATDAASALAQLFNITGESIDNVDRFGATIVELGNNAATTENDIMEFATRIAGSASQVDFTSQQILALSTSLASVGLNAEAGGTAISTVITQIDKDVANNADTLQTWADTAGMSVEQFRTAWETDAYGALQKVIEGMGDASMGGENLNLLLAELGITGIRTSDTMKRLSGASKDMSGYLDMANTAWDENNALVEESGKRYETTEAMLSQIKETIKKAARTIGDELLPYVRDAAEFVAILAEKFANLDEGTKQLIVKFGLIVAAIGPALLILSKVISVVASIIKVIGIVKGVLLPIINAVFLLKNGVTTAFLAMEGFSKGVIFVAKGISLLLNPITLVIAAIGALIGVFVYLYKTNEDFRNKVIEIWETIKEAIGNAVEQIGIFFTETIPEAFNGAVESIGNFVNNVIDFFTVTIPEAFNTFVNETIPNAINSIVQWFEQLPYMIGYAIGELIGYFYLFATNLWTWITTELPLIIEGIIRWFAQLPSMIWGWLTRVVTNVIEWGVDMYNNAVLAASNFVNGAIEWISQLPSRIWTWLVTTVSNVISWGANMIAQARQTASNFVNSFISFIASLPSKVWGIIKQIPSKVSAIGSQLYNAGRNIFQSLWNGIKSVGESILGWVSDFAGKIRSFVSGIIDGFQNIVSGANEAKSAARSVDGKHANGLDYVPYNGYVAELHEGERVLTKQQNKEYNEGKTGQGGDTFNFYNTKPTPYEYARQMKKAKKEMLYGI